MGIGYKTLERLLLVLFGLSESQRRALLGRFKYLQRLGGFGSQPSGRGRARYGINDLLQLVMIFELIDVGCSPAHSLRIVRTHWDSLPINFAHAWADLRRRPADPAEERLVWAVVPHSLAELGAGGGMFEVDLLVHLPRLLAACVEAFAIVAPDQQEPFAAALDGLAASYGIGLVG
jgi:hypothetical protein